MGMFDYVEIQCQNCGHEFTGQSKGGPCNLNIYTLEDEGLEALEALSGAWHLDCPKCEQQHDIIIKDLHFKALAVKRRNEDEEYYD